MQAFGTLPTEHSHVEDIASGQLSNLSLPSRCIFLHQGQDVCIALQFALLATIKNRYIPCIVRTYMHGIPSEFEGQGIHYLISNNIEQE